MDSVKSILLHLEGVISGVRGLLSIGGVELCVPFVSLHVDPNIQFLPTSAKMCLSVYNAM